MYIFEIYQSLCLLIAVDSFCAVGISGRFQCFVSMQVQMLKLSSGRINVNSRFMNSFSNRCTPLLIRLAPLDFVISKYALVLSQTGKVRAQMLASNVTPISPNIGSFPYNCSALTTMSAAGALCLYHHHLISSRTAAFTCALQRIPSEPENAPNRRSSNCPHDLGTR